MSIPRYRKKLAQYLFQIGASDSSPSAPAVAPDTLDEGPKVGDVFIMQAIQTGGAASEPIVFGVILDETPDEYTIMLLVSVYSVGEITRARFSQIAQVIDIRELPSQEEERMKDRVSLYRKLQQEEKEYEEGKRTVTTGYYNFDPGLFVVNWNKDRTEDEAKAIKDLVDRFLERRRAGPPSG